MAIYPKCPKCGLAGAEGVAFIAFWVSSGWFEQNGLDPIRTSAIGFVCLGCAHEFPAATWTKETFYEPQVNVITEGGSPINIDAIDTPSWCLAPKVWPEAHDASCVGLPDRRSAQ